MKNHLSHIGIFGMTVILTVSVLYILPYAFPDIAPIPPITQQEIAQKTPRKIEEQITQWENIVGIHPDYRDGYVQLAYFYYLKKDTMAALEAIDKALSIDPNYQPGLTLRNLIIQV